MKTDLASFMKALVGLAGTVVLLLVTTSPGCDGSTDPSRYFGGSNHQAYLNWYNSLDNVPSTVYPASRYFSPETGSGGVTKEDGMALHWNIVADKVNERASYLQVAIAVRAMNGWVGFGLADAGGMFGADVMLYESENPDTVRDAYILWDRLPLTDDCQDWELIDDTPVIQQDGFLIVQARRLLDTLDAQDKAIINDQDRILAPTRIIGAWGNDTASASYHGPYRILSSMRFHDLPTADHGSTLDPYEQFQEDMTVEAEGYFELRANNYTIPKNVTTYYSFCISWNDILAQGVPDGVPMHVIGFEPIMEASSGPYWHHFTLNGIEDARDLASCTIGYGWEPAYAWAPGALPDALPEEAGLPIGQGGYQGFSVVGPLRLHVPATVCHLPL